VAYAKRQLRRQDVGNRGNHKGYNEKRADNEVDAKNARVDAKIVAKAAAGSKTSKSTKKMNRKKEDIFVVYDVVHVIEVVAHVKVVNVVFYLAHDFISRRAHIQMRQSTLLEEQNLDRKIVSRANIEIGRARR
jgi:hypothetical protein